MKLVAKVGELKNIVKLASLESDVTGTKIEGHRKQFFTEALLRLDAENNVIRVSKKQTEPPMFAFTLTYDVDEGKVEESGEIAIDLEKFDNILSSFSEEDKIHIYEEGDKIVFEREKPKKRVFYTPLSVKEFGEDWRWESPYEYDHKKGELKKRGQSLETALAVVSPEAIKEELKSSSYTSYDRVTVEMSNGRFMLKLGGKLLYSESELTGTVRGEVNTSYAVGFDNIFSTLAKFGGEADLVFIKPQNILYVHYNTGKFKFEALLPSILEEE